MRTMIGLPILLLTVTSGLTLRICLAHVQPLASSEKPVLERSYNEPQALCRWAHR